MTHSLLFGHLPIITKLMKHMPQDVHPNYIAQVILENWEIVFPDCTACPGIFYVDLWPMGPPTIFSEFCLQGVQKRRALLSEPQYALTSKTYACGNEDQIHH